MTPESPGLRWRMEARCSRCASWLAVALALAITTTAHAETWKRVAESVGTDATAGVTMRARVFEEDDDAKRGPGTVGNTSHPENTNARKLVIELADARTGVVSLSRSFALPSETIPGDPCAIAALSEPRVARSRIEIAIEHEFACGAGSSVAVAYVVRPAGRRLLLASVTVTEASRDRSGTTVIDYERGFVSIASDRPEDASPGRPVRRRIARGAVPLAPDFLSACPRLMKGRSMPACRM